MSYLYEIVQEAEQLIELLDNSIDEHGAPDENIIKQLEIKEDEFKIKMAGIHYIIEKKKSEIALNESIIKSIQDDNNKLSLTIDTLKNLALSAVNLFGNEGKSGNKTVKIPGASIYTVTKDKLIVDNEDEIDNSYKKFVIANPFNYGEVTKLLKATENLSINKTITTNMKNSIDKKMILEDIQNGITVKGATTVDNTYLVFRKTKK